MAGDRRSKKINQNEMLEEILQARDNSANVNSINTYSKHHANISEVFLCIITMSILTTIIYFIIRFIITS
jgi:hypothetical protein